MTQKRKHLGGRPTLRGEVGGGESRRVSVRLTDALIDAAERLGDGSLSEGVRMALAMAEGAAEDMGRQPKGKRI